MDRRPLLSRRALALVVLTMSAGTSPGQDAGPGRDLAGKARELRQKHAAVLVEIGTRCAASDLVGAAATVARTSARLLDPAIGGRLVLPAPPAVPRQRGGKWMAAIQIIEGIHDGIVIDPESIATIARVDPLLAELAVAHAAAAEELGAVVADYRALGDNGAAFELAELCYALHHHTVREQYLELADLVAQERYDALAMPHMEQLRRSHDKLGKSKGWKLKGMAIEAPKPHAADAALIARAKLEGDFELEVDARFEAQRGKIVLVAAWLNSENYCGLEYDRDRYPTLSLIHVDDGERKVLASIRRPRNTFEEFFRLRVRVAGGRISTDLSTEPCAAELPTGFGDGARYGILRPGFGHKPSASEAKQAIRLRNFIVR